MAYLTRTVLAERKKLTRSRQGALDAGEAGEAGHDRADVAAGVEDKPAAKEQDADLAQSADRTQRQLGGEFEHEDATAGLVDVAEVGQDLGLDAGEVAARDPVRRVPE